MIRTTSQIREHYDLETALADRLRHSTREARTTLYNEVYNDLFSKIKHHPQLTRKNNAAEIRKRNQEQLGFLSRFIEDHHTYLEVGAGDCGLTFAVAEKVKQAIAVDVSPVITENARTPDNFELRISDGRSIPVPPESIDIAYSNQLMEHLHEEDAFEQLGNIYQALVNGGSYICVTPNRVNGPHDVSAYFDKTARGLHLKEYTWHELKILFRKAGFSQVNAFIGKAPVFFQAPLSLVILYEYALGLIPHFLRKRLLKIKLLRFPLFIRIEGVK